MSEADRVVNVVNMCGFDSGLGKEINESVLRRFPSSLEVAFAEDSALVLSGVSNDRRSTFKNELERWEIQRPAKKDLSTTANKALLNAMYYQMLFSQKRAQRLPLRNCRFVFKSETDEVVQHGVELLFIHSLVFIRAKAPHLVSRDEPPVDSKSTEKCISGFQGEFGFVVNFDREHVHVLTPFAFGSAQQSQFEIQKSDQICLDLDQQTLAHLAGPLPHAVSLESLPFKGLKLSKKISTKLRKKISKRRNTHRPK